MSGYTKPCVFCNQEIRMSNDSGKWSPYNLDNTAHECRDRDKSTQQPQTQPRQEQQTEQAKTVWTILEDYNKRLKRVEAIHSKIVAINNYNIINIRTLLLYHRI